MAAPLLKLCIFLFFLQRVFVAGERNNATAALCINTQNKMTRYGRMMGVACGSLDTRRAVLLLWDVFLMQRSVSAEQPVRSNLRHARHVHHVRVSEGYNPVHQRQ
jgi:hypothetical protein